VRARIVYGRCYYPDVDRIALPGERRPRYVLSVGSHCRRFSIGYWVILYLRHEYLGAIVKIG